MNLFPTSEETLEYTAAAIRNGVTSCVAVVERCLAAIDAREAEVKAWVSVDREGALQRAQELDAELAQGNWVGPLHGIPVGIKDIVAVANTPTGGGSEWHAKLPSPTWDAEIVTRLRNAGAIILGKTVTTQFASFDPPPTHNPWKLDRTPGGSSSGSAAAVATGMCLAAIGSQTGGSITRPASFCGVAGCKPTFGTVSLDGILPLAPSMDHPGPIARTVRDLALMLSVISDDFSQLAVLAEAAQFRPRIGHIIGFFDDCLDAGYAQLIGQTLKTFGEAGALVADITGPAIYEEIVKKHRTIMACEAAAAHLTAFEEHRSEYGPCITTLIEEGLATRSVDYITAQQHQKALRQNMLAAFQQVDVLVTPATVGPAPDAATTGDPRMNSVWSYLGYPTVSFPIGLSEDGLPLALQFIGRSHEELTLFQVAIWCESVVRMTANNSVS